MRAHDIVIEHYTEVRQPGGIYEQTWATFKQTDATVTYIGGQEFYQAQQTQVSYDVNIVLEYDAAITTAMRVKHGNTVMSIQVILPGHMDLNGYPTVMTLKCSIE